jgi:hypothetical protein
MEAKADFAGLLFRADVLRGVLEKCICVVVKDGGVVLWAPSRGSARGLPVKSERKPLELGQFQSDASPGRCRSGNLRIFPIARRKKKKISGP